MGAVVTMRPDLVNAVLMGVPFVDIVTTMLDASIPLTTIEVRLAFRPIMLHKLAAAAKSVPRGSRVLHRRSGVALPGVPDNCAGAHVDVRVCCTKPEVAVVLIR